MGVGVGLQLFRHKQICKFPRAIVWEIFGPKARLTNEGWGLMYDNGPGGVLYLDDDMLIDHCSVMRPSGYAIADLFRLAQWVRAAISEDDRFFVTEAAIIAEMPDFLLNALPIPPRVVGSAEELLDRLAGR